ncbi:hypothetical protein ACFL3E_00055 [Patescibacteria group bacterium]
MAIDDGRIITEITEFIKRQIEIFNETPVPEFDEQARNALGNLQQGDEGPAADFICACYSHMNGTLTVTDVPCNIVAIWKKAKVNIPQWIRHIAEKRVHRACHV